MGAQAALPRGLTRRGEEMEHRANQAKARMRHALSVRCDLL